MFSLDFSLFYDNTLVIVLIFFFYIAFQKLILSFLVLIMKLNKVVSIVFYKELYLHNYLNRSSISFNYFDSSNILNETFFLSVCKPVALNYSYLKM
jgi:hypothetical protein